MWVGSEVLDVDVCWPSPATNQTKSRAERSGHARWERGDWKRGTEACNGRKGVGTQGRHYARLMMRESEGEEAVHAKA